MSMEFILINGMHSTVFLKRIQKNDKMIFMHFEKPTESEKTFTIKIMTL